MKRICVILIVVMVHQVLFAQEQDHKDPRFYFGASLGTSFPIRDFKEVDINNPDAGFAKNGRKFDIYGGRFLNDRLTVTGILRYQTFETDIDGLIETFNNEDPGADFRGTSEDWKAYYLLLGLAYRVVVSPKVDFFPRFGLGPLVLNNPGVNISSVGGTITNNFSRNTESGFGLGYELGIGLRRDLGKHFALMPTFTFSGGVVTIPDLVTTTDSVEIVSDYQPRVQSFTLGLSLAYLFQ
ncbi:MAG: outer membrane beta-barrel protein [Bacteroidota bacterium]